MTARAKMMSRTKVTKYFDALDHQLQRLGGNISIKTWNMDETGVNLEHTPTRIVCRKGTQVNSRVSCNRDNVTVVGCINGAGQVMPPTFIVRGKTPRSLQSFIPGDGPAQSIWTYQERAWIDSDIIVRWFQDVFLKNCGPQRPQLLILDQHISHEVLSLLELAVENQIIILGLPPHTSHWLQPLDKGCYGPLKQHYNRVCSEFMSESPQNVICKPVWARVFNLAWEAAMTEQNARKGFEVTGIVPFNPARIPDRAYEPGDFYEQAPQTAAHPEDTDNDAADIEENVGQPEAQQEVVQQVTEALPVPLAGTSCTFSLDLSPTGSEIQIADMADAIAIVNSTFSIETASQPMTTKRRRQPLAGHRLLTDPDFMAEKSTAAEAKKAKKGKKAPAKKVKVCKLCMSPDWSDPSIYCENCEKWMHQLCVPRPYHTVMRNSIDHETDFICHICAI